MTGEYYEPWFPGFERPSADSLKLSKYAPFLREDAFYLREDSKWHIALSGGQTSAFLLYQILERNGGLPDNAAVVFANTGRESEQTLEFLKQISERWDVPIAWVEYHYDPSRRGVKGKPRHIHRVVDFETASRNGEPFMEACQVRKTIPTTDQRFCTSELKILTAERYIERELGWKREEHVTLLGIRADEPNRAAVAWLRGCRIELPLMSMGVTRPEILKFWREHPFRLNTPWGNCDGCFMKPQKLIQLLAGEHPERLKWWADLEEKYGRNYKFRRDMKMADIPALIKAAEDIELDDEEINLTCYCGDD